VTEQFLYPEHGLADALGISSNRARAIREMRLREDVDWKKIAREIMLTESGAETVARVCDADLPKLADCLPQKNGANGSTKKMRVVNIPMNPRMVLANESGEPGREQHLVYVGRNATFAFGDEIEVRPSHEQKGVWELTGAFPRERRRVNR
jgi:hypothetical protein